MSNLKILRKFCMMVSNTHPDGIYDKENKEVRYKDFIEGPILHFRNISNNFRKRSVYIFNISYDSKNIVLMDDSFSIKIELSDVLSHDDLELILKCGRGFDDDSICSYLSKFYKLEVTLNDFSEFLR